MQTVKLFAAHSGLCDKCHFGIQSCNNMTKNRERGDNNTKVQAKNHGEIHWPNNNVST